jgi:hypothetical protein
MLGRNVLDCSSGVKPVRRELKWQLDGSCFVHGRHWIWHAASFGNKSDALMRNPGNKASLAGQEGSNGKVWKYNMHVAKTGRCEIVLAFLDRMAAGQ